MKFKYLVLLLFVSSLISCSCNKNVEPDINPPKLKVIGTSVEEGDEPSEVAVEIQLSDSWKEDLVVEFATKDQSAVAGEDYEEQEGTVTIPAGSTTGNIFITVVGDTLKEPDETVEIIIRDASPATVVDGNATITIRNDDDYVFIPDDGYTTPTSYAGYKLVWRDEFDGDELSNDWHYEIGDHGWGNNELQYYTNGSNVEVVDDHLIIEARKEDYNGAPYTSSRISTSGRQSFRYGRVDIRAVLPEGQGIWPALWMLGSNISTIGWPGCGEIDIMELVGHEPSTVHGTIHWENAGEKHASYGNQTTLPNSEKFRDEFHVFSITWDENSIKWYLDDVQYNQVDITKSDMTEFHAPFFFIFNIAVGGDWPGYPDATTVFPQRMMVDYIRVFERL